MESAMVPSFFISTPIPLFPAILGTANGTIPPLDHTQSPIGSPSLFGLSLYKGLFTWRGHFPKHFKIVFRKNGELFLY